MNERKKERKKEWKKGMCGESKRNLASNYT